MKKDSVGIGSIATFTIIVPPEERDKVILLGLKNLREPLPGHFIGERHNAFTNLGLQMTLNRLFSITGPPAALTHIMLSSDNTTYELTDTTLGGTVASKVYAPAASIASQTVTAGATFTQADVAFSIRKVGLTNTATDAGTGLLNIIGGSNNSPFTIDLTGVSTWSLLITIAVTASAT